MMRRTNKLPVSNPQTRARPLANSFIHEARAAGWRHFSVEVKPDGSVIVNAHMPQCDEPDDFLSEDLRMKK